LVIEKTGPEITMRHIREGEVPRDGGTAVQLAVGKPVLLLRSPLAHARIVSIDASAALAHPKVHLVLTGKDLEARGLAWMPTMSDDTQAVLATDKVRSHGQ
jgi:aerobic carbon-monoxide dehydrogenase large subunit